MNDPYPFLGDALDRLSVPDPVRALILSRHGEPHRHYHTLRHIDLMLGQLPADHAFAPEMIAAALFHDIIYDPTRSDNEEASLAMFLPAAGDLGAEAPPDVPLVSSMILATKSHHFRDEKTAEDAAVNSLLKADLSILWHSDPEVYEWYAQGVRREYGFVPDAQFRQARGRILSGLRDDLLCSDKLTAQEANALRRNTGWELRGFASAP